MYVPASHTYVQLIYEYLRNYMHVRMYACIGLFKYLDVLLNYKYEAHLHTYVHVITLVVLAVHNCMRCSIQTQV